MAFRQLLGGSKALVSTHSLALNATKTFAPKVTAQALSRSFSTSNQVSKSSEEKATSIIASLPGDSMVTKTGYIAAATGLTALLISKEIYVFNEETVILAAFASLVTLLYTKVREPMKQWGNEYRETLRDTMNSARQQHLELVDSKISSLSQLSNINAVNSDLFALSKEIVKMEAEIFEKQQEIAFINEVKAVLDSHVRYERSVRESEQKQVAEKIVTNIRGLLKNPKFQQDLVQECLADLKAKRQ
ncbi:ATP synthase subunit 4, mitochondrial [Zancudomyces culisetae]|uniref:ATP synthase subunit 4 n=1 Tax=Zancudomyces culisetae TaxID=1213189 RepID=A0A1R1PX62_ZANCU|nr:ATP synthase subunit 4, mitochondrial [Zancudomyces culisetae]|eukprot:OMH85576.1 ATP synthase subunit 4, mitochondrial [Zancudomyces culisetae]